MYLTDDDLNILPSDFLPQDDIMRDDDIMNLIEDISKEENAGNYENISMK